MSNKDQYQNIGYVYVLKSDLGCKIGRTFNIPKRESFFANQYPFEVNLVFGVRVKQSSRIEKMFHKMYADKNIRGEWFRLTDEDIENIRNIGLKNEISEDECPTPKRWSEKIKFE